MSDSTTRVRDAISAFAGGSVRESAVRLLNVLGYNSDRVPALDGVSDFLALCETEGELTEKQRELFEAWSDVKSVFQFTEDELLTRDDLFTRSEFLGSRAESFLFLAVELGEGNYARGRLAAMTRAVNRLFAMPVIVIYRYQQPIGDLVITIAVVHRRPNRKDPNRDVLERVTLVKDVRVQEPHRAHLDVLAGLSLDVLAQHRRVRSFDQLHQAWEQALDTEPLNRRFYKELFTWFERAVDEGIWPPAAPPEQQVIRCITRVLFVWFIKEKGLVAEDWFDRDEIGELLLKFGGSDYYRAVLQNLFFATLNVPIGQRAWSTQTNKSHRVFSRWRYRSLIRNPGRFEELMAQTPFINGGLFDCLDDEDSETEGGERVDMFSDPDPGDGRRAARARRRAWQLLSVPDDLFFDERGLLDLFTRFKFTVEENTPAEIEVALDPELLGKVFENLLAAYNPETRETARKETGSYYTPRPVVDHMVDEALVVVLGEKAQPEDGDADFWRERLRYLLDYEDAGELFEDDDAEAVVRGIAELKVLDPAVGSGAFPMAVLNKLTLALRRLDPDNELWQKLQKEAATGRSKSAFETRDRNVRDTQLLDISETFERYSGDFGRKLYLIQNTIYGVDIQAIACQIAKLRFFISLAIEQNPDPVADNFGIKPLPNLETRFVAADALLPLDRVRTLASESSLVRDLERRLVSNRERHFHATTRSLKLQCMRDDGRLRRRLSRTLEELGFPADTAGRVANWDPYDQQHVAEWFDAEYMFGIRAGFDLVIGNPPYVKVEHLAQSTRNVLKGRYGWRGDLYDHFIFAGYGATGNGGVLSFIVNDSYLTFSSKLRIRKLFLKNRLTGIVRAPAQTFEATIYTAIFLVEKGSPRPSHAYFFGDLTPPGYAYREQGRARYSDVVRIPGQRLLLTGDAGLVLRMFALDRMESVCQILDTGIDSGNCRGKLFFSTSDGQRERLLQGRQIQRYLVEWDSPRAKYRYCNINYKPLPIPGVGRGGKPSKKNEYWSFRGDIANHHRSERLLLRQTDDDLVAAYHSEAEAGRFYTDNTLFTILSNQSEVPLKYILALLNSRLLNWLYHAVTQEKGKSQAQVKVGVARALPVVVPGHAEVGAVVALVEAIMAAKLDDREADIRDLQEQIDEIVFGVYGLTDSEVETVRNSAYE